MPVSHRLLNQEQRQRGWSSAATATATGGAGPGGSSWTHAWFGFAAAAAAAAAAGFAPLAAADAPQDAQPDSFWRAAVSSAQLVLSEAFAEVLQDWDRAAAQHNTNSSSSSSSASGGPQQPSVKVDDGRFLSVSIPLLPGADTARLLRVIDSGLDGLAHSSSSSSQSQTTTTMGASRMAQFDLDRTVRPPPQPTDRHQLRTDKLQQQQPAAAPTPLSTSSSSTRQHLSVQVVVPLQQPSPHDSSSCATGSCSSSDGGSSAGGYVSIVKPGAAFTADELALLARLVAAANTPGSSSRSSGFGPGPSSPFDSPLGRVFGELMRQLQSDLFDESRQQEAPDWKDLAGRWQGFLGGLGEQLPGDWQQQLQQQQLEQQLAELAPPEVMTWLQQLDEQQQQETQQKEAPGQLQLPHSPSSSSSAGSSAGSSPQLQAPEPLLPWQQPAAQSAVRQLQQLGAQVYLPAVASALADDAAAAADGDDDDNGGWGVLAGYQEQKAALEDCLLLPLKHPEVFDAITARTRRTAHAGSSRPRAVLFEGPPGTGKTSCARVLSRRAVLPLVYVPLEALASKWYGESEQNLAKVFKLCEGLGGAIIFLDELDSLATSRDRSDMHEASRRLLGVLLREIDGFENSTVAAGPAASSASSSSSFSSSSSSSSSSASSDSASSGSRRSVLIGATNRRQDLDAALLSRFDLSIHFGLPDAACRAAIMAQYAAQLEPQALAALAAATPGFSGRDLRDVAEQAERAVAAATIRGELAPGGLPGLEDYLAAVRQRQRGAGRGPAMAAAQD